MNKPVTNAIVTRLLLLLNEFDITIIDETGKENVFDGFLSPRTNNDDNLPIEDSIPDEHFFAVSAHSPWYTNVANYLAVGKLPIHLWKSEKRQIIQQSARYCYIDGHRFYTGLDLEIRICVREDQIFSILKDCHDEPYGGHFADKKIGHKVLQMAIIGQ